MEPTDRSSASRRGFAFRSGRTRAGAGDMVVLTADQGLHQTIAQRLRHGTPLLWLWIARDLRARYRQSWLRAGWSVIQPVVLLLTYGWVLTAVLDVGDDDVPYLSFAWAGLVVFMFTQQALGSGVGSIQQSRHIITKVYFPREVLPLAAVGAAVFDMAIMTVILVVLAWVQVGPPTIHVISVFATDLVLVIWIAAIVMLAATAAVFRRDVIHVTPLVLRALFILSPVMYATSLLEERAPVFVSWNPLSVTIESTRDAFTRHEWPNWSLLAVHLVVATGLLLIALAAVRRYERRMSDWA